MQNSDILFAPFMCFGSVFSCFWVFIWLFFMLFIVVGLAFWIWMLVDVIQRKDEDFPNPSKDQKLLWLLIVILTGWIGGLVYYLMVYKVLGKAK